MTDVIKYLKLLIVQLESVPVLLGYSRSKEALWTRAVNFLLPRLASSRPETEAFTFPPRVPDANINSSFPIIAESELLMWNLIIVCAASQTCLRLIFS